MAIKIHSNVTISNMKKEELIKVKGGSVFSAQSLNSIIRGVNALYNLGVALGSAIRRAIKKKVCY